MSILQVHNNGLVQFLCYLDLGLVIDHRFIILNPFLNVVFTCFFPIEDIFSWDIVQFRDPFLYVYAFGIVFFCLEPGVEDSNFSGISTDSSDVLPVSGVLSGWVIDKFLGKVFFTLFPVHKQIFYQKRSDILPSSIVHIACYIHLSHSSVNKRNSSGASFPSLKPVFVFVPFKGVKLRIEVFCQIFFQNIREFVSYVSEKLSPMKLKD